ncbi:response regulator transcription factor [Vibrio metschnikovii]|nr:response regulator transcription factor [Vibrio metschnikovii]
MLRAIVVEDEYLAQEELRYLIEKHSDIEIIASFDDGLSALKYLQNHPVEVLFLDINMPAMDGMLLARSLSAAIRPPYIIFTTAYKEHAAEAFELDAFDYLLKPLNEQRVQNVLDKLQQAQSIKQPPPSSAPLHLMRENRIRITEPEQVIYAMAKEKITLVYCEDGEFYVPYPISELCDQLPAQHFFRCHRSYCVNLTRVQEIIPWVNSTYLLHLQGTQTEIPVSRSNLKAFRERMQL